MRKQFSDRAPHGAVKIWTVLLVALCLGTARAHARDWYYYSFGNQIQLVLDTNTIAIFDPTPAPVIGKRMISTTHGLLPAEALAADWSVVDLTGTPSGGDPAAIEALIEELASDPMTDEFVSPVFNDGSGVLKVVSPNVLAGFQDGVPEATILADLATASLGTILETDWLRPNTFVVDGSSRSGRYPAMSMGLWWLA